MTSARRLARLAGNLDISCHVQWQVKMAESRECGRGCHHCHHFSQNRKKEESMELSKQVEMLATTASRHRPRTITQTGNAYTDPRPIVPKPEPLKPTLTCKENL
jgi:hypothetical protein